MPDQPCLIDSHSHFDDGSFDTDRAQALARARAAGVKIQIIPSISAAFWPRLRATCRAYPGLYPAYGLHPMFLSEHQPEHLSELETWLVEEQAVAVGECGLDYYSPELDPKAQRHYFLAQLSIARNLQLPVIIHARHAVDEVLQALRKQPGLRGVVHSFSGSLQQAQQLCELGFCLSFGGPLTYERAKRLRQVVQALPIEALLIETDAPDQPLSSHRGERNEPAYLPEVLSTLASLRNTDANTLAAQLYQNTLKVFKLSS